VAAAGAAGRRELSRVPDQVRHTEKWRLALEMIEEMTGPGGVGRPGAGHRSRRRPPRGGVRHWLRRQRLVPAGADRGRRPGGRGPKPPAANPPAVMTSSIVTIRARPDS
jgi:hypothetical protein